MNTRRIILARTNKEPLYVCYDNDTHLVSLSAADDVPNDWSMSPLTETLVQTGRPCFSAVALYKQGVWLRLFMRTTGAPELSRILHELKRHPEVLYDMSTIRFTSDNAYMYCNRLIVDPAYVLQTNWLQDVSGLRHYSYFKTGRLSDKPVRGSVKQYVNTYNKNSVV